MKKIFLLGFIMLSFSCSDDDDMIFEDGSDLEGTWLLVEQYVDPGDGSGDFRGVDSNKTITFTADNTYTANGSLCFISTESDGNVSGIYQINDEDITEFSSENYLIPEDCNADTRVYINFDGSSLVLSYLCIEGCAQKYRKQS